MKSKDANGKSRSVLILCFAFAGKQLFKFFGSGLVSRSQRMAVNVHGCGYVAVPKSLRSNLCVHALIDEQRGRCMAQIMKANVTEAVLFDELAKPQVGAFMMEWCAVGMAEYEMSLITVLILAAFPSVFKAVPLLDAIV
jgi:hypothetical protein